MSIRTPEDEVDKPGYLYPPFKEGWHYQGATYAGHSDFSVDFNRRTPTGGWLDDRGDPVLAAADGTVAEVDVAEGLVLLNHHGGLWRTEYRHMQPVLVKVGQKVERSEQLGGIGEAGNAPNGTHLHHVHWRRTSTSTPWRRVQMRFEGIDVAQSVLSSGRADSWTPPAPKLYIGPPAKATWEDAYRQADRALTKCKARVLELEQGTPPADCAAVEAERDAYKAQAEQLAEDVAELKAALAEFQPVSEVVYVRKTAA